MDTLSEIIRGGFKRFKHQAEERAAANITTVKYIDGLAISTGTDAGEWDVIKLFQDEKQKGIALITDRAEINKRFFEESNRRASSVPDIGESLDMIKAVISKNVKVTLERQKDQLKRDRDSCYSQATNYINEHYEYLKRAFEYDTRLKAASTEIDASKELEGFKELLLDGFWAFHKVSTESEIISFTTKAPITLRHTNKAKGIDMTVNMGKFLVELSVRTGAIKVRPFEGNILTCGYPHPHVSSVGDVCWGTAKATYLDLVKKRDFPKILRVLAPLLSTYSYENPYRGLHEWYYIQKGWMDENWNSEQLVKANERHLKEMGEKSPPPPQPVSWTAVAPQTSSTF